MKDPLLTKDDLGLRSVSSGLPCRHVTPIYSEPLYSFGRNKTTEPVTNVLEPVNKLKEFGKKKLKRIRETEEKRYSNTTIFDSTFPSKSNISISVFTICLVRYQGRTY